MKKIMKYIELSTCIILIMHFNMFENKDKGKNSEFAQVATSVIPLFAICVSVKVFYEYGSFKLY